MSQSEAEVDTALGIHWGMADPKYRKAEGISQSQMKELLVSPAHFMARYGPNAEPFFPSGAMINGTATHCRVLEPDKFENLFYDRSTKPKEPTVSELKAIADEMGLEYKSTVKKADLEAMIWPEGKKKDNRTSLSSEDFRKVLGAADALRTHDITGDWFCPGQADYQKHNEVSMFARNELGQTIKGRADRLLIREDEVTILDLKTISSATKSATARSFTRALVDMHYDMQAAWYTSLARHCFPSKAIKFVFVAVELRAPYGIGVFSVGQDVITSGLRKMEKALDLFEQCKTLEYWPGYDPVVQELKMPAWGVEEEQSEEF